MCWVDGNLWRLEDAVVRADDSAFAEGRGCYTSVRIANSRPRFVDRHIMRLQAGARELRLGEIDAEAIRRALAELAEASFPDGEGVIRLQVSQDGVNDLHLVGVSRDLGEDRSEWSAIVVSLTHDGACVAGGQKVTSRLTLALAAEDARIAGVDEAVLLDTSDCVVEGARSNLFVSTASGSLWTPALASGAVAGIARTVCLERVLGIEERTISKSQLFEAREIIAVNAVRGARPITSLDGCPIEGARFGSGYEKLSNALASD